MAGSGFPFGLVNETLPVYLRTHGASLVDIGLVSAVSFPWTFKRPIPAADETGELGSGGDAPPDLFLDAKEFWRRWNSRERLAVLIRRQDRGEFMRPSIAPPTVVAENARYMVVTNFPPSAATGDRGTGRPGPGGA